MPFIFKGTAIKKLTYQATQCKKHIANGVQVWGAIPEYLFSNGAYDGEYLTGISNTSINNSAVMLRASQSLNAGSGRVTNTGYSNYMDLDGAATLSFDGYAQIVGYYQHSLAVTISLEDINGNTIVVTTFTHNFNTQNGSTAETSTPQRFNASISDFTGIDMSNVRIKLYIDYYASIPWSNWYNSGGAIYIENIACN